MLQQIVELDKKISIYINKYADQFSQTEAETQVNFNLNIMAASFLFGSSCMNTRKCHGVLESLLFAI